MLRKVQITIDNEEYTGLVRRETGLTDEEAVPLLLEERIEACEKAIRGLRENIRDLLVIGAARENAGTVLTMGENKTQAPADENNGNNGKDEPGQEDTATESKPKKRGAQPKDKRSNLSRMKHGKENPSADRPVRKKKEEIQLDPLVEAVCDMCRISGDGECMGCPVKKALALAECQETLGSITHNAKAGVCARCLNNKRIGGCAVCRLEVFWKAKEARDSGSSIEDAAAFAEAELRAEIAERG